MTDFSIAAYLMKKRNAILAFKIIFILAAFALLFWKADTAKIWEYIKTTNPLYLLLAYLIMIFAQIVSGLRMRYYYARDGLDLNHQFSIGLYFTSMLFNTVLPGGIGGDGYKIYTIGKLAEFPHLRAFKIALSERGSGLFALLFLTSVFYIYADFRDIIPHQDLIIASLTALLLPCYFISASIIMKEKIRTAFTAMLYSFPIQLLNVAIFLVLLIDLGVDTANVKDIMGYIVIFMVSSVASIIPISIGGAGLREITFLYGAKLTGLNAELGITVALLFFVTNILCALTGLLFWHRLEKIYNNKPSTTKSEQPTEDSKKWQNFIKQQRGKGNTSSHNT